MPLVVKDRVMETTSSTGTGTITLGGAVAGYQSFSVIGNGNTTYYTIAGGTEWEVGLGTYTSAGTTLSRTTVLESSNGNALVNFSAGTKNVFVTYPAEKAVYKDANDLFSEFPSGTAMLFVQTTAPTGWTKSTTHDNKALRVVSGTASSGGSVAFTTAFASQAVSGTVGDTTLTTSQIPSHTHSGTTDSRSLTGTFGFCDDNSTTMGVRVRTATGVFSGVDFTASYVSSSGVPASQTYQGDVSMDASHTHTFTTGGTGGGGSHNHSFSGTAINLAVQYVDVIIATKD